LNRTRKFLLTILWNTTRWFLPRFSQVLKLQLSMATPSTLKRSIDRSSSRARSGWH